jgi:peroxiredoxin
MLGVLFTLLLGVVPLAISGCPASSPPAAITADSPTPQPARVTTPLVAPRIARSEPLGPKVALAIPETPPEPLHEPRVELSEGHRRTCLVQVGDLMPQLSLPDLEGKVRSLSDLYGERLTVVVFWNDRKLFAREQFTRLGLDIDQFQTYGVSVVAINVGDSPEIVAELRRQYPGAFECLVDQRGESLARVANDKLPRTYLLDAEGRIVWFDLEFSRGTERELRNALYWHLLPEGQRYLPTAGVLPAAQPATGGLSG